MPIAFAKQHRLLPIRKDGTTVTVATADPLDVGGLDDLRGKVGGDLDPLLVPSNKILDAVNQVYGRRQDAGTLGEGEGEDEMGAAEELVDILDVNDEAPIIRWVNSLMFNAVKERASDIHIEPGEKDVIVRYRIDGVLYETRRAARQFIPSIISRVKIMAGLNIAEKRLPQDGRIRRKIAGKDIDMRVATAPTVKGGERITIRLLDRENILHDLADIGFGDDHLRQMDDLIHRPARHHVGHRAHRLGQDHHALCLPGQDQLARSQHPDHRGSGRVPARRHLAGGGEREDRSHLRQRLAFVSAPRSGRDHGGRNPRPARPPRSPSRLHSLATWCCPPSTPTMRPAGSPAWWIWVCSRSWWPRR